MRKTFSAKRNALFSPDGFSWGVCALVGALLFLVVRLVAPDFFSRVFSPLFQSADALAARSHALLSGFGDTAALARANEALRAENSLLALENETLRASLTIVSALQAEDRGIVTSVIARPPENPYDTLILAAGSRDGVAVGMVVAALPHPSFRMNDISVVAGVPIGTVSSVTDDFSRATLFSSPGVSTPGWVGAAYLPLTIIGRGAGAMQATLPRTAPVAVGDIVHAAGPGPSPIGKIARIEQDPSSPTLTLHIASAANLFSVVWVAVRDTPLLP